MLRALSVICLVASGLWLMPPTHAESRSVRGEVVDLACHLDKGDAARGVAHGACAMTCARRGEPMVLLAADAIYRIAGDYTANGNAKLLDFVGKQVEAKGQVTEIDGTLTITVISMGLVKD